jgi:hypothetical protein
MEIRSSGWRDAPPLSRTGMTGSSVGGWVLDSSMKSNYDSPIVTGAGVRVGGGVLA